MMQCVLRQLSYRRKADSFTDIVIIRVCGLAWKSPLSLKMELLDYLSKESVVYEQVVEILL